MIGGQIGRCPWLVLGRSVVAAKSVNVIRAVPNSMPDVGSIEVANIYLYQLPKLGRTEMRGRG